MKTIKLPPELEKLSALSTNLWWTWNEGAEALFRRIDPSRWEALGHNPIPLLRSLDPQALLANEAFMAAYQEVVQAFENYMSRQYAAEGQTYAYFCMEYGLHSTLPIYSGGLGVLAADHLKEASDMNVPLVAVGLLYRAGFFSQSISADGEQRAGGQELNLGDLPLHPLEEKVEVEIEGRLVQVGIWKLQVGRTPLYLLDTGLADNRPADRAITSRLYPSDGRERLRQEIVLGIGGVKALKLLGFRPRLWHMNEGHSALMAVERIAEALGPEADLPAAISEVKRRTAFTTHTPVPAGHEHYAHSLIREQLGVSAPEELLRLGDDGDDSFSMTKFALLLSHRTNAVSKLHGEVARGMWEDLWPDQDPPIDHITNGVHTLTWLSPELKSLFDLHLAADWRDRLDEIEVWEEVPRIPDPLIWQAHLASKRRLFDLLKRRASQELNLDRLTIGFARRFAPYKRASLIFTQPERLQAVLDEGVQVIFAGKAHPDDQAGRVVLREVVMASKSMDGLVFVEDYDLSLARSLVQGVDLWLNTPLKPNEASGTSGQKAAINGALNCSILDGWWPEAYDGSNGWAFGDDAAGDAESLYRILEEQIFPTFQDRSEWIARMKHSIRTVGPRFSTRRMLRQYLARCYRA